MSSPRFERLRFPSSLFGPLPRWDSRKNPCAWLHLLLSVAAIVFLHAGPLRAVPIVAGMQQETIARSETSQEDMPAALPEPPQDVQEVPIAPSSANTAEGPQESIVPKSQALFPYRRVFLPKDEISQIRDSLDSNYAIRSWKDFADLIKTYSVDPAQAAAAQSAPELVATIYSARLIGPDLVSNRSLIRVSRGSVLSERIRLSPWSLAVVQPNSTSTIGLPADSRASLNDRKSDSRWAYDGLGTPSLSLHSQDPEAAIRPADLMFGWVMRGQASTVATTRFQAKIPRCKNSCLLLALPPFSSVVQSNVPAIPIQELAAVEQRLHQIPADVRPTFERLSPEPNAHSLWLLELSGVDSLEFSVTTRSTDVFNGSTAGNASTIYEHLVLDQDTEHRFEGDFLVCKSDLELQWPKRSGDRYLQFQLPPKGKVQRIAVGGKDVEWKFEDGMVSIPLSVVSNPSNGRNSRLSLSVELLFPSSPWASPLTEVTTDSINVEPVPLPLIAIQRSYVFRGRTKIVTAAGVSIAKLVNLDGYYADPSEVLSSPGTNTLHFQWWDKPDRIALLVQPYSATPSARALTKLMGSDNSIATWVRIIPPAQMQRDLMIEFYDGWGILDVWNSDTRKTIPWETISKQEDRQLVIRIPQENVPSNINAIDLYLDPPQSPQQNNPFQWTIPANGLVKLSGWNLDNVLMLENLPSNVAIENTGRQSLVPLDSLSAIERSFLTNTDRAVIWKLSSSDFTTAGRRGTSSQRVEVFTSLSRDENGNAQVVHRFRSGPLQDSNAFQFTIESNEENWTTLQSPGRIPPEALRTSNAPGTVGPVSSVGMDAKKNAEPPILETVRMDSRILFTVLPASPNDPLDWTISTSLPWPDTGLRIPLPKFENNVESQLRMELGEGIRFQSALDSKADPANATGEWSLDSSGELSFLFRKMPAHIALVKDAATQQHPPTDDSEQEVSPYFDLALDASSVARIHWRIVLPTTRETKIPIRMDPSWSIVPESLQFQGRSENFWPEFGNRAHEFSVRQLVVPPKQTDQGQVVIEWDAITQNADASLQLGNGWRWSIASTAQVPHLYVDNKPHFAIGNVWVSRDSVWKPESGTEDTFDFSWPMRSGVPWWSQAWNALFDSNRLPHSSGEPRENLPDAWKHSLSQTSWLRAGVLEEKPRATSSERVIYLTNLTAMRWYVSFAILLSILTSFISRSTRFAWGGSMMIGLGIAFALLAVAYPLYEPMLAAALSGIVIGWGAASLLTAFRRSSAPSKSSGSVSHAKWEGSHSGKQASSATMLSKATIGIAFFLSVSAATSIGSAQDAPNVISDIVIQVDDNGKPIPDSVHVPQRLLSALSGAPSQSYLIYGAKYQWRINYRNRPTATPDQLTIQYDLWVGRTSESIKIPITEKQASLIRLSVDDIEITTGNRLLRTADAIEWRPDRTGRRTIQLVVTPLSSNTRESEPSSRGRGENWTLQNFQLGVLPTANATLEIDSIDSLVQIDVDSLGGITNPSPGRYNVALGNTPMLNLKTRYPQLASLTNNNTAATSSPPSLNIELILQNRHLRAKTVINVPEDASWEKSFSMEADEAWTPIGTRWGNVSLVDVRPASNVSRRRYVFEMDAELSSSAEFEIGILWGVKDPYATTLNVLFAECVDSRVRPNTLRFYRQPDSEWNIEMVSSWTQSIHERDRLEWSELNGSQSFRATSLRFPPNGGSGSLTRISKASSLQARVTTRWILLPESQTLTIKMETIGNANSDFVEVTLPHGFIVTEASEAADRSNPLRVVQDRVHAANSAIPNVVKIFSSRQSLKNAEILIRAERPVLEDPFKATNNAVSFETPWISNASTILSQQSVDLFAPDSWMLQIQTSDGSTRTVSGKGSNTSVATLSRGELVSLSKRPNLQVGNVSWSLHESTLPEKFELVVAGNSTVPTHGVSKFTLEIALPLLESLKSNRPTAQIPCPISDFAWVQIDLGNASAESPQVPWSIQFQFTSAQLSSLADRPSQLRILDHDDFQIQPSLVREWLGNIQTKKEERRTSSATNGTALEAPLEFRYLVRNPAKQQDSSSTSTASWKETHWYSGAGVPDHFALDDRCRLRGISLNGKPIEWTEDESGFRIRAPSLPERLPIALSFDLDCNIGTSDADSSIEEYCLVNAVGRDALPALSVNNACSALIRLLNHSTNEIPETVVAESFAAHWIETIYRCIADLVELLPEDQFTLAENDLEMVQMRQYARWQGIDWSKIERPQSAWSIPVPTAEPTLNRFHGGAISYVILTACLLISLVGTAYYWQGHPEKLTAAYALLAWLITGSWLLSAVLAAMFVSIVADNLWIRRNSPLRRKANRNR